MDFMLGHDHVTRGTYHIDWSWREVLTNQDPGPALAPGPATFLLEGCIGNSLSGSPVNSTLDWEKFRDAGRGQYIRASSCSSYRLTCLCLAVYQLLLATGS